ncbi:MAG: UDP-N-acetylmuramoyl-L-alanyl-D-glutamate--2,6-diaminopimelate ligase, partial [Thermodesulfobacteriota bacterium]|nr:UDP-N-acetylmuramoyl-L-alanyl-D-glutamate--2,6-diaminopimelate ligase [Thermodesulfobacteriota bacterium]
VLPLVPVTPISTNGKTTTAALVEHMLVKAGKQVGVIGTGNFRYVGRRFKSPLTTPESADLQQILRDMATAGVTHVVMEVSSHALAHQRVAGCAFDVAIFTNLTQDHLDFHGDMETYWECKKRLFTGTRSVGAREKKMVSVINCNDARGKGLFDTLPLSGRMSAGFSEACDIYSKAVTSSPNGLAGTIVTPAGPVPFCSPLAGTYNLENILCAAGAGVALGVEGAAIQEGIKTFAGVPGRLEKVADRMGRFVFVDYAHTPDALENVLSALRKISVGRLFCVFGCGGDRDRAKRPKMGRIAATIADRVVVTSDNPRSEDPEAILADIVKGMAGLAERVTDVTGLAGESSNGRYLVEPDRRRAIRAAVTTAAAGDTILIAGKGEENYQIFRDGTIDFDDRQEAAAALQAQGKPGNDQMPAMSAGQCG